MKKPHGFSLCCICTRKPWNCESIYNRHCASPVRFPSPETLFSLSLHTHEKPGSISISNVLSKSCNHLFFFFFFLQKCPRCMHMSNFVTQSSSWSWWPKLHCGPWSSLTSSVQHEKKKRWNSGRRAQEPVSLTFANSPLHCQQKALTSNPAGGI